MNYADKWDRVYRKFARSFPKLAAMAVDGYFSGEYEITLYLDDGSKIYYNELTDSVRSIHKYDGSGLMTEEAWREEFGRRLMRKMRDAGLTQTELAAAACISQGTVSNCVHGRATPNTYQLVRLAEVLQCSINDLTDFNNHI